MPDLFFKYKYDDLFNPTLTAIHNLGGSGSVDEIEEEVIKILKLNDEQINEIHRANITKLSYRLAWARNYLKRYGLLENSARSVWALTSNGRSTKEVDQQKVKKTVVDEDRKLRAKSIQGTDVPEEEEEKDEEVSTDLSWQESLLEGLQSIKPAAFERLCMRLLRELGFQNVEVTGRTNDGGVDGKGLLRVAGVLSFHVIFQAKRYKGSVSPSIVRDFRGAMVGRADKGLIITTGSFTREAKKEASRDGATPIELIDGNDLAEKLKELRLGIEVELVEKVKVDHQWFQVL
jgi:restriction system protein